MGSSLSTRAFVHFGDVRRQVEMPSRTDVCFENPCGCNSPCSTVSPSSGDDSPVLHHAGDVANSYEFEKDVLGEGTFGIVRRAHYRGSSTERAIKSMRRANLGRQTGRLKEVVVMEMINHLNVARLYETFSDEDTVHLVVELCRGGNIFELVDRIGPLGELDASTVMADMFNGLAHLHTMNIVHRDLKPENVMLLNSGPLQGNTAKIVDFGSACECLPGQALCSRVGTTAYMAPEVRERRCNTQCDLWSAGATLYFCLSSCVAFPGRTHQDVRRAIRRLDHLLGSLRSGGTSENAMDLVTSLLREDATKRITASQALDSAWVTDALQRIPACDEDLQSQTPVESGESKIALDRIEVDSVLSKSGYTVESYTRNWSLIRVGMRLSHFAAFLVS